MSAADALATCRLAAPGADWSVSTSPAGLALHATFPDGTQAATLTGSLPTERILRDGRIFRTAERLALAWVDGVLR